VNIKALYSFKNVRLFLVKRVEKQSGQVLYGAGVGTFSNTEETKVFLQSSGRRLTVESALEDILDQTMAELSEEVEFGDWCIKESKGNYYIVTKRQITDNELTSILFCSLQMMVLCDGLVT